LLFSGDINMEDQILTPPDSGAVKLLAAQVIDPNLGASTELENSILAISNNSDLGSGTVVAGQMIIIRFQYVRLNNGVEDRSDRVVPFASGQPGSTPDTAGRAFSEFRPSGFLLTFQEVRFEITTIANATPPGLYTIALGGISSVDGVQYTPGIFRLTVQPTPKRKEKEKEKEQEKGKERKDKEQEKSKERKDKEKERLDTLAKPKEKDNKDVKGEKSEDKEFKQENKEFKDFKPESKELKGEKSEKSEKESVKDAKDDKRELKEFNKDIIKDKDFDGGPLPLPQEPIAFGAVEERLSRLESAMGQLRHFISPALRPDLAMGALRSESDYQPVDPTVLSQQLQQRAMEAKQAKDNKDVEKLNEQ
jgi:flagellar biosynthesis GTPase FlhF